MEEGKFGKVYFIGAGPGDPELLTIKAAQILSEAEVVLTDRLVSEELIREYVNPQAIIIPVGKQGGSSASTSQQEISDLIVQFAASYKNVVRLKGGDVTLYSNILDELLTVNKHDISYEMIPGITALSGAAAYAGIPLTARGLATGVRTMTYYQPTAIHEEAWKELAKFNDTLVFYMTGSTLPDLINNLLKAGAADEISFLVIEQATTPNQYVHHFTLREFQSKNMHAEFLSPSLVIMGKVAALYEQFAWLPNENRREHYFKPLPDYPELISFINHIQETSNVSRA